MKRSDPNRPALIPPPGVKIELLGRIGGVPTDVSTDRQCDIYFFRKSGQGYKVPHEFLMGLSNKKGLGFICDAPFGVIDLYLEYKNCRDISDEDKLKKQRLARLLSKDLNEIAHKFY